MTSLRFMPSNAARFRTSSSSQPIGRADSRITGRKVLGVAGHEQHRVYLRGCPDHGIGQFDPMVPAKADGALRTLFVDGDDAEATQEMSRRSFEITAGADHDLHPCYDADRFFLVA